MIEAGVICFREGDDKFAGTLVASVYTNTSRGKSGWVHEGDELEEQVWLRVKQLRCFGFDGGLELFRVLAWNPIPCLGLAPMHCIKR